MQSSRPTTPISKDLVPATSNGEIKGEVCEEKGPKLEGTEKGDELNRPRFGALVMIMIALYLALFLVSLVRTVAMWGGVTVAIPILTGVPYFRTG